MTTRSTTLPESELLQIGIDVGFREGYPQGLEVAVQVISERNKDLDLRLVRSSGRALRQVWEDEKQSLRQGES